MRTEQEVLKVFEERGWKVVQNNKNWLKLKRLKAKIVICKKNPPINIREATQEHKLLNELFTIWGWLE